MLKCLYVCQSYSKPNVGHFLRHSVHQHSWTLTRWSSHSLTWSVNGQCGHVTAHQISHTALILYNTEFKAAQVCDTVCS